MKSSQGITWIEVLVIIVIILILLALLFPAGHGGPTSAPKAQAKNDVTQIATAMIAFETEYGHLPGTGRQVVGGDMLAALIGSNTIINPRKIVFIEVEPVKKGKGGLSNGAFVDPWDGPYQIAFASGTNSSVKAGTNEIEVEKKVAVWNDPNLGANPPWWSSAKKEKRYVTSWD